MQADSDPHDRVYRSSNMHVLVVVLLNDLRVVWCDCGVDAQRKGKTPREFATGLEFYLFSSQSGYRKLRERKCTWRCSNCKSMGSPTPLLLGRFNNDMKDLSMKVALIFKLVNDIKKAEEELLPLNFIVSRLENDMNARWRRSRNNNIDVKRAPFTKGANLMNILLKIGTGAFRDEESLLGPSSSGSPKDSGGDTVWQNSAQSTAVV
ncbi:hypothetical protein EVAR_55970_1 [Eumeta japonica]|uniref:Uncharacterized protein n=1 Tax=Eumeta variegata TaxID=151549 RepID=A0A4C1YUQ4_EUMVA|nr:hypothetical protein EVAR_55970_1 [Eumeta japonica]